MPWSSAAWIAAIDSLSSCGPQLNFPLGPPTAQAPKPIVVSCGPCEPSCRCSIDPHFQDPEQLKVPLACGSMVLYIFGMFFFTPPSKKEHARGKNPLRRTMHM